MAIIQRQGVGSRETNNGAPPVVTLFSKDFTAKLGEEFLWVGEEGERLLDAFVVPPMQVVAGALNFVTILVSNRHFIELPLNSIRDFKDARALTKELGGPRIQKAA